MCEVSAPALGLGLVHTATNPFILSVHKISILARVSYGRKSDYNSYERSSYITLTALQRETQSSLGRDQDQKFIVWRSLVMTRHYWTSLSVSSPTRQMKKHLLTLSLISREQ
jgi:hypothetical protein